ncbi:hypothetical protein KP509_39G050000 [Ceratopteris richardii]|uniref:Potassium transporter n=1 Tax=Ceratopteris richardii TaxID=49495 RepID=A0A8T2Q160_CERRI|nr:hypothetical protein KP509_39G050000 [Ceratopteris richardii]KAH7277420.1 hypothetical protein KP509_39G050000 [Ceratopteris richardii]
MDVIGEERKGGFSKEPSIGDCKEDEMEDKRKAHEEPSNEVALTVSNVDHTIAGRGSLRIHRGESEYSIQSVHFQSDDMAEEIEQDYESHLQECKEKKLKAYQPSGKFEGKHWRTLVLAYQAMGVVYAGIGTCPLYVFSSFTLNEPTEEDYFSIFSIVFWTFTAISLVKYCFIILRLDDQGEGGTFALYSVLCKHVNISRYGRTPKKTTILKTKQGSVQDRTINFMERNNTIQIFLFAFTMIGACMVIGDGIITPAISVLSAVDGLRNASSSLNQSSIVIITSVLLIALFLLQRFGTRRVGFLFSPIVVTWFVTTAAIGVYNVIEHNPTIFKALSPHYIIRFFIRRRTEGWRALAGTVLCITSSEAIYADLGHFSRLSMQVGFISLAYPSNILTYAGQAAYLTKHLDNEGVFYNFIPKPVYWPMFAIATLAAIVASQCLISACFSLVKQSVALDLFPKVRLIHTSENHEGQIYSPEVNYFLMSLCVIVVLGLRSVDNLGHAYGVAVIMVMFITTCFASIAMVTVWNIWLPWALLFFVVYATVEGVYISAVMSKIPQGGWLPFLVAVFIGLIMYTWVYGREKHHAYEKENRVRDQDLGGLLNSSVKRVPGVCIFYCDFDDEIPPLMRHYLRNIRSFHKVVIFTTVTYCKVPKVPHNERFKFSNFDGYPGLFRCTALYGYAEERSLRWRTFFEGLIDNLKLHLQFAIFESSRHSSECLPASCPSSEDVDPREEQVDMSTQNDQYLGPLHDMESLQRAIAERPVLVIGRTRLITTTSSLGNWLRKSFLDIIYRFLYSNSTSVAASLKLSIPPGNLMEISMLYEV